MKQLILFRHGKSSWDDPSRPDTARPLIEKGVRRTLRVAEEMKRRGIIPDLIVSSPAIRAMETARIVAGILGIPSEKILIRHELYHASVGMIWDVVSGLPVDSERVVLFGHNPGFTEFANQARLCQTDWMPTSGVAGGEFNCLNWYDCVLSQPVNTFSLWPAKLR